MCKKAKEDLQSAWDQPILDMNEINNKLYKEVQECADLQVRNSSVIASHLVKIRQLVLEESITLFCTYITLDVTLILSRS